MRDKHTILFVDDDRTTRDAVAEFLAEEGFGVVLAADGVQALEVFDEARPAVVVTDLEMPRLSGAELVRRIRRRAATPVIVITGHGTVDAQRVAEDAGADGFLNKPIDLVAFLDVLQSHLSSAGRSA